MSDPQVCEGTTGVKGGARARVQGRECGGCRIVPIMGDPGHPWLGSWGPARRLGSLLRLRQTLPSRSLYDVGAIGLSSPPHWALWLLSGPAPPIPGLGERKAGLQRGLQGSGRGLGRELGWQKKAGTPCRRCLRKEAPWAGTGLSTVGCCDVTGTSSSYRCGQVA